MGEKFMIFPFLTPLTGRLPRIVYAVLWCAGTSATAFAAAQWLVIAGFENTYTNQFYTMQPINLPSVSTVATSTITVNGTTSTYTSGVPTNYGGIVNYQVADSAHPAYPVASPASTALPLSIIDHAEYSDRKMYNTKLHSNPFIGLEAAMSENLLFRMKLLRANTTTNIVNIQTSIYTPVSYSNNSNILKDASANLSTEILNVKEKPFNTLAMSFLFRMTNKFYYGLQLRRSKKNIELSLSNLYNTTLTSTFKPTLNELGFETLYKISDYMSLNTSFQISKKKNYINRLLNFKTTAYPITYGTIATAYGISYIPLQSGGWQACNGVTVDGSPCTTSADTTNTVTDYYYNASTPNTYPSSTTARNLNTSLGPQLWFSRFYVSATIALEWDLDVAHLRKRSKKSTYYS